MTQNKRTIYILHACTLYNAFIYNSFQLAYDEMLTSSIEKMLSFKEKHETTSLIPQTNVIVMPYGRHFAKTPTLIPRPIPRPAMSQYWHTNRNAMGCRQWAMLTLFYTSLAVGACSSRIQSASVTIAGWMPGLSMLGRVLEVISVASGDCGADASRIMC